MTDPDGLTLAAQLPILRELAVRATDVYALPPGLEVSLINLSENATCRVQAPDGRRWALRMHRDGYHSRAVIASKLARLTALRRHGVVVTPRPVAGRDGEVIQVVGHPLLTRPRHVVLSDWEAGEEPGIAQDLTGPFEALGEVTAWMHRFTRDWIRPTWFTRPVWNFQTFLGEVAPHWGHWRDGIGVNAERAAVFGRTVAVIGRRLAAYGVGADRC